MGRVRHDLVPAEDDAKNRVSHSMEKVSESGEEEASSEGSTSPRVKNWTEAQDLLKQKLGTEDDFTWRLPIPTNPDPIAMEGEEMEVLLKYVGGVDISFSKDDPSIACGTLVVLDLQSLQVVFDDFSVVRLQVPYVPGFLAFREAPVLLQLLEKMKNNGNPFYPQLLMVDGNGVLHPRGFGLASHLGVIADLPTIGIGKNLHHVDGLTQSGVRKLLQAKENSIEGLVSLKGHSGRIWGVAMKSTKDSLKPIFISIGHRISLDTAVSVVKMTCKYRLPEPIRQADIRSRDYLQKNLGLGGTT